MSAIYPAAKRALMQKQIDLVNDSLTAVLIKNTYTYAASHTNYTTDISAAAVSGASVVLSGKAVLNTSNSAVFDANDPTFTAVVTGSTVSGLLIYHTTTGTPIVFIDSGAGLPAVTSGADITINFSNGGDRIFAL